MIGLSLGGWIAAELAARSRFHKTARPNLTLEGLRLAWEAARTP